jgi:hypothetical protein
MIFISNKTKKLKIKSKQNSKKQKTKLKPPRKISAKSKKYKKRLKSLIKNNLGRYKKGVYKSRKQAIAVSYKQNNRYFKIVDNNY